MAETMWKKASRFLEGIEAGIKEVYQMLKNPNPSFKKADRAFRTAYNSKAADTGKKKLSAQMELIYLRKSSYLYKAEKKANAFVEKALEKGQLLLGNTPSISPKQAAYEAKRELEREQSVAARKLQQDKRGAERARVRQGWGKKYNVRDSNTERDYQRMEAHPKPTKRKFPNFWQRKENSRKKGVKANSRSHNT